MKLISKIGVMIALRKAEGYTLPDNQKLTQKNLARELGVQDIQLTNWVKGRVTPRTPFLFHLAHLLNCKVDDLLEFVPPTEEERQEILNKRSQDAEKKEKEQREKKIINWRRQGYSEEWIEEQLKKEEEESNEED
jgi:transcriptional regulator with XRE-family HTH domain